MENKYSKPNTTRKKVKFLGTKEFIDASTGEKETMQVTNIEERDANFHKIWLGHMLESLDMIGNQKIRVAMFIMENINKENELIMTYRVIAEKTRKKVKFLGTKEFIDASTGEKETMQVTNIEERDANFHKIWLGHMLESLDMIGNQKIRVAMFIMENINKENELIMTYRVIAEKT